MGRPAAGDLEWLVEQGVTHVVSLTETPLKPVDGIDVLHVPVVDMTAPTLDQLHKLVDYMRKVVAGDGKVVAHCMAGVGRTGTALAAYMVGEGMSAAEAIAFVRALRPGSIETDEQERAVEQYAELIGGATG